MTAVVARRCWHVLLALAFLTAYLTGDVATFGRLHSLAGMAVLVAIAGRLGAAALAPADGDLALRRPRRRRWLGLAAGLVLVAALAAAASGLTAEAGAAASAWHARLSDFALAVAGGHMSLMLLLFAA